MYQLFFWTYDSKIVLQEAQRLGTDPGGNIYECTLNFCITLNVIFNIMYSYDSWNYFSVNYNTANVLLLKAYL